MKNRTRVTTAAAIALAMSGCGHVRPAVTALDEADRTSATATSHQLGGPAQAAFEHAEKLRQDAHHAREEGDDTGASLLAESAVAAYQHAVVLGRAAAAVVRGRDADAKLAAAVAEQAKAVALRERLEKETETAEAALADIEARLHAPKIEAANREREAARLIEARALVREGRELCEAAFLLRDKGAAKGAPPTPDAGSASAGAREASLSALEGALRGDPKPVPIADAANARLGCLRELTRARRAIQKDSGRGANDADELLSLLGTDGKFTPSRDERGVVVSISDAIENGKVTSPAEAQLRALALVAAAHPNFALELEVERPTFAADAGATGWVETGPIVSLFTTAGVPEARVGSLVVGKAATQPDSKTGKRAGGRLFVVFIASDG